MIETVRLSKTFGANKALNDISLQINEGEITGLVGTNGAGKSTLLRIIAGILRPDSGQVSIDGKAVYDNPEAKRDFFFVPDEPYFFTNANGLSMAAYYESIYPTFDMDRFRKLSEAFSLPVKSRISTYSKGMKRQLCLLLSPIQTIHSISSCQSCIRSSLTCSVTGQMMCITEGCRFMCAAY